MEKTNASAAKLNEMNRDFSLEDINPDNTTVEINGKAYTLRKVNLDDEKWLKSQGDLQEKFAKEDMDFISRFAFRQLVDKTDFLPCDADDHDEDGNPVKVRVNGPTRLLRGMSGPQSKVELIKALCVTIGISRPLFDKMVAEAMEKETDTKKKNRVGAKSGT